MPNLLDTIRQNNPALQQQGVTDESQKLQGLLRAKSGKAVEGGGVASSNLGEQQAVTQANTQMQNQVAPQVAIANQGQQQQQQAQGQQETQQVQAVEQQRKFDTVENKMKTNQLMNDFQRNSGRVDLARDKSSLEQLGFQVRLQNKQYTDQLQREGNMRRLSDQNQFNQQLSQTILGDQQSLLEKQLGNKSVLDASDRDFKQAMAKMDVGAAYDMFKTEQAAAKQRAMWSGIGSVVTTGVGAYGASQKPAAGGVAAPAGGGEPVGDISTGSAGAIA